MCRAEAGRMFKHLSLLAALAVPACVGTTTSATTQDITRDACPANVPASLAPAADQDLSFVLNATGTQNYTCTSSGWTFVAPDADLYLQHEMQSIVGHHFAGPTWEYEDGSFVVARKTAAATVDTASIAWLLLVATSHGGDDGRMTNVTSIQRLETSGGNAPAGACAPLGGSLEVPYTASYYFYVTRDPSKQNNQRCGS
jgi:hypothetical protein